MDNKQTDMEVVSNFFILLCNNLIKGKMKTIP